MERRTGRVVGTLPFDSPRIATGLAVARSVAVGPSARGEPPAIVAARTTGEVLWRHALESESSDPRRAVVSHIAPAARRVYARLETGAVLCLEDYSDAGPRQTPPPNVVT
jgi:hypothetical protein